MDLEISYKVANSFDEQILNNLKNLKVEKDFEWRDKCNEYHSPCDMSTSHIFFTLRMIWNHSVPEHMQLRPFIRYTFDTSTYTRGYIRKAIRALLFELIQREDLTSYFISCIQKMHKHLTEVDYVKPNNTHNQLSQ